MDDKSEAKHASDAELVQAAQHGNAEAFGSLYRRYLTRIFRYVRSRISPEQDAEDVTESVFVKAFEALENYEERGAPFGAYLYQIARNAIVDYYRADELTETLDNAKADWDERPRVERQLIKKESVQEVEAALATLPEHYREVIRLRLVMDLPTDQVAQWMGREPSTIRVIQHRALKALRQALGVTDE